MGHIPLVTMINIPQICETRLTGVILNVNNSSSHFALSPKLAAGLQGTGKSSHCAFHGQRCIFASKVIAIYIHSKFSLRNFAQIAKWQLPWQGFVLIKAKISLFPGNNRHHIELPRQSKYGAKIIFQQLNEKTFSENSPSVSSFLFLLHLSSLCTARAGKEFSKTRQKEEKYLWYFTTLARGLSALSTGDYYVE